MARLLDAFMIARFRKIYATHTRYRAQASGYAGLVEEMTHSLRTFSPEERRRFDQGTLPRVLGGPLAPWIRAWARKRPQAAAKVFLALIPTGLRYLIGPSSRAGRTIQIPRCKFLAEGGPDLCQHVCKAPTEHFFGEEYHLAIEFAPKLSERSCTLTFNGQRQSSS